VLLLLASALLLLLDSSYVFLPRDAMLAWYVLLACLSICLSQAVLSSRINVSSRKQYNTVAQGLQFSDAKGSGEIPIGLPKGASNIRGVGEVCDL